MMITKMKNQILLLALSIVGSSLGALSDDCPSHGSVSRFGLAQEEGAEGVVVPSPAPSSAPRCTSQTSNARGQYTSTRAPCIFAFHSIQNEEENRLIDYQTSNLCSEENSFLIMKEYVVQWHDECVGDFARCYSLEHHKELLLDFLCAMNWNIPDETTHVSVNCMEDKVLVLEDAQAEEERRSSRQDPTNSGAESQIEQLELSVFNAALIMGCCLVGIFVISRTIVKPLVAHSALRLDPGLVQHHEHQCPEDDSRHGNGRWISSQNFSLEIDESEHVAEAVHEDFDLQIPADFDAIPIVTATILPHLD